MTARALSARSLLRWLSLLALAAGCHVAPIAAQELIAHPSAEIATLTRNEARLYFTLRLKTWPNGRLAKVFVLPDNHPIHQRFTNEILGLYPYQLRRVWDRQIFSGTGQAPITVDDEQEMIQRVATTPGAIGYAAVPNEHPDLRVLQVR